MNNCTSLGSDEVLREHYLTLYEKIRELQAKYPEKQLLNCLSYHILIGSSPHNSFDNNASGSYVFPSEFDLKGDDSIEVWLATTVKVQLSKKIERE